uniref:Putative secreted peptide n=1 Tax=Anopheles braziliensis TaxID=58242 RepID=A0A2M3ZQF2_9DIPT
MLLLVLPLPLLLLLALRLLLPLPLLLLFTTLLTASTEGSTLLARIAVGFTGVIFVPSLFGRLSVRLLLSADRSLLWLCSALAL